MKNLNIVVKADVQGSAEAVKILPGEAVQRGGPASGSSTAPWAPSTRAT